MIKKSLKYVLNLVFSLPVRLFKSLIRFFIAVCALIFILIMSFCTHLYIDITGQRDWRDND